MEEFMVSNNRLVLRSGPTPGKAFPLDKSEMFIGRDMANEIVINDPEVSRRHARVFVQAGNTVIEDLGSTNGTSINGQRLTGPYIMRPGELITFGEHISLYFESETADSNATVAATRIPSGPQMAQPSAPPPPIYQTPQASNAPAPLRYQAPPPPPTFSGRVPVPPLAEPPQKKGRMIWIIVVIVVLLIMICACAGILYYIDSANLWCSIPGLNSLFSGCPK
jgi:predicted component of type VI protein secretion system